MTHDNRLTHDERLRGEIRVSQLFAEGKSFVIYPFRVVYRIFDNRTDAPTAILVSIPKKRFKRAVKRNRLRRCTKEAFRLNKNRLNTPLQSAGLTLDMAIIYLDKEILPYHVIEQKIKELLDKLVSKVIPTTPDTQ